MSSDRFCTARPRTGTGQAPLNALTYAWIFLLVLLWAGNSVLVKIVVRDIPPMWAALLRFAPATVVIALFIRRGGSGFRVCAGDLGRIAILGVLMALQITTFNWGSRYTTGGRVTLFIFSYPLFVPLLGPLFINEETLSGRKVIGSCIAFVGIVFALRHSLDSRLAATYKGDLIELGSALLLALNIVYNKRLMRTIDKWRVIFWEFLTAVVLFGTGALLFEDLQTARVKPDAWAVLVFQSMAVSVFCFMSWQHLLARHNSANLTVSLFATPLLGMLIGVGILQEPMDISLLIGCLFVGAGIYVVNRRP